MSRAYEPSHREAWWIRLVLPVVALLWLFELVSPVRQLLSEQGGVVGTALALGATLVFAALYIWVAVDNSRTRPESWTSARSRRVWVWGPCAVMAVIAVAMNAAYGSVWLGLFIFAAVAAAIRLPAILAAWTIAGLTLAGGALALVAQVSLNELVQGALLIGGIGAAIATVRYSIDTTRQLRAARAEVARLAITEERLRFARDLHDLLGHSLSLIALKCDLATELVSRSPDRARVEMEEAAQVTRSALREVREAVAGYRQPSLAGELAGAREVLAAAGIAVDVRGDPVSKPPLAEAALAWAVREGVTNVVRHSRARRCTIRVAVEDGGVSLEVLDDGTTADASGAAGAPGSGLAGLSERLAAVGGSCQAGPVPSGGFRLRAWVPGAA